MNRLPQQNHNGVLAYMFPDKDVTVIEGEFHQDEDEDEQDIIPGPHLAHVNKGPQKLRQLLATELEDDDRRDMQAAMDLWSVTQPPPSLEPGEPYRGECPPVTVAQSMRELVADFNPVQHITPAPLVGAMSIAHDEVLGVPYENNYRGIIDFDYLLREMQVHGVPEDN